MDNRLLLVLKFGEKENLIKLQKGQVFCRNANYYSKCEEEDGDTSRGDKYECKNLATNLKGILKDKNGNEIMTFDAGELVIQDKEFNKTPMFCSYGLTLEDIEQIEEDDSSVTFEFDCERLFKDTFDKGYWPNVLILFGGEFMQRIKKTAKERNIDISYRKVRYYDPSRTPIEKELELDEDFSNIAFWKINSYKDQNEFRIIFKNHCIENDDEGYILDIGDLSDCSKIFTLEELKGMKMNFVFKKKMQE